VKVGKRKEFLCKKATYGSVIETPGIFSWNFLKKTLQI
jgi:hypothetical protein